MTSNRAITANDARTAILAVEECGSQRAAARALGLSRPSLQRRLRKAQEWGVTAYGEMQASIPARFDIPRGKPTRYILSAAQSNTHLHPALWQNILALAEHYNAKILIGRIRYNQNALQMAQEKDSRSAQSALWYDQALESYFSDSRIELAPGLIWAGDMNIIPTATDPLAGLDAFTGKASAIFPHPQIALKSVPTSERSAKQLKPKMNYTTGALTLKNYIKRKAGLKAEFHHSYGALLVEVDKDGAWFARQLSADQEGTICDLDIIVKGGVVRSGNRISALTPGDIHGEEIDVTAKQAVWGESGLMDCLRPEYQFLHDILNFGRRSHHANWFDHIKAHYNDQFSVEDEIINTADILRSLTRSDCVTYVVKGNHDEHLERWVLEADYKKDPPNALFYLEAARAQVLAIKEGLPRFDLVAWAFRRAGLPKEIQFLARDEPLEILNVRHDLHGDKGPNGARGSPAAFARMGDKVNIGHSHSASIVRGCYQSGTMSKLDMGYNRGPSSWSHSLILTYQTGKRAIITLTGHKWRAE